MFETECLHTPYLPPPTTSNFRSPALKPQQPTHVPEADLLNLGESHSQSQNHAVSPSKSKEAKRRTGFNKVPGGKLKPSGSGNGEGEVQDSANEDEDDHEEEWVPDVFLFEYGTVVIWGMTEKEEKKFLASLWVHRLPVVRLGYQWGY